MDIVQLVTGPLSVNTWCFPLDEGRIVVVDPGGDADLIIAHLEERHSAPALFLLTHGHFDHLTALPELVGAFPGTPVVIHEADAFFLGEGAIERHRAFMAEIGGASIVARYPAPLPGATAFLRDGDDLCVVLGDSRETGWKVIHTPGHSKGSLCLYNEGEKILISGDTLFNAGIGRTDAPGGSVTEIEESLGKLSSLPPDTVVLPGHGRRTRIGDELGM